MRPEDDVFAATAIEPPPAAPAGPVEDPIAPTGDLPQPLEDPMRTLGRFLGWGSGLLASAILLLVGVATVSVVLRNIEVLIPVAGVAGGIACLLAYMLAIWRILPKRTVDLVYLRSFRNDRATSRIRFDLHRAIGRTLRVSGIRDPRRRWPKVARFAFFFLFALRHVSPRYLNLEAGDDWKRRLWRTLGEARGAIIDVSDLTRHVVTEIRLCQQCLDPERILFIGDGRQSVREWEAAIRAAAPELPADARLNVAIWTRERTDRERFREAATQFAEHLPSGSAGHRSSLEKVQETLGSFEIAPRRDRIWRELAVGVVLGLLIWTGLFVLSDLRVGWGGFLVLLPIAAMAFGCVTATLYHFACYLRDCDSHAERALTVATFALVFALPVVHLTAMGAAIAARADYMGRVADSDMRSRLARTLRERGEAEELTRIGTALHAYRERHGRFPAANASADDSPPTADAPAVSWRVKLLPFLLDGDPRVQAAIDGYRPDEPWDSEHNLQFVEEIPFVYRPSHSDVAVPAGQTRYQAIVSPGGSSVHAIFVEGEPGPALSQIPDGGADTVMIAEAHEPVPWTCPRDLNFAEKEELPRLHFFDDKYQLVVDADGTLDVLSSSMADSDYRARFTANGGESIFDP